MMNVIILKDQMINMNKVVRIEKEECGHEDDRAAVAKIIFDDGDCVYTDESYDYVKKIVTTFLPLNEEPMTM